MKKLKVGVIGLGMGRAHIEGYRQHKGCEVVGVADVDKKRLKQTGDELGITGRYTDAAEMLKREKLDIVSVVTPNKFHKPLTIAALKAGCHVLCDKPMAMSAAEGRQMLAAAKKARRRLMINFSYRFSPASQGLRRLVDKGQLGKVYFGRTTWHRRRGIPGFGGWFTSKALAGGGPLIDLGVHRIDLALWLMGHPKPQWALAGSYDYLARKMSGGNKKLYSVEDLAAGLVKFSNGAILEIEASWAANIGEAELMETRLFGTKAGLVQRNRNGGYEFEAEMYCERGGRQLDLKVPERKSDWHSPMHHFVDRIRKGRPHDAGAEQGILVMEILDALYKSAKLGKPVKVR